MGGGRAWARELGVIVGSRETSAARPAGMDGFAALHARAKAGLLSPAEREEHRFLRGAFLAAITDLQNAGLARGQIRRATVRIRRAMQVDLSGPGFTARTATLDVGLGGFCALLPEPPGPGALLRARLRLPGSRSLDAVVAVVSARRRQRAAHVSFAFRERTGDWTLFEDLVVDHLLVDLGAGGRARLGEAIVEWLGDAGRADVLGRTG